MAGMNELARQNPNFSFYPAIISYHLFSHYLQITTTTTQFYSFQLQFRFYNCRNCH